MLSRGRLAAGAALALAVCTIPSTAWGGDGDVKCPPLFPNCQLTAGGGTTPPKKPGEATGPGTGTGGGSNGGGGGSATCYNVIDEKEVPCFREGLGWFNPSDACYWKLLQPQPADDSPSWQLATGAPADRKPGQGALYQRSCKSKGAEQMSGTMYSASPPPGFGGPAVDPAQLAQQIVKNMELRGADIGIAPKPGSASLVGLPVWLWTNVSDTTWGPKTASASAGGVTVTATAHVERIIWTTGDGATVTCTTPGKPYLPAYGTQQPECGHTYGKAGRFAINATSKWVVDWSATTGQGGRITTDRQSATDVAIAEAQALNTQ